MNNFKIYLNSKSLLFSIPKKTMRTNHISSEYIRISDNTKSVYLYRNQIILTSSILFTNAIKMANTKFHG